MKFALYQQSDGRVIQCCDGTEEAIQSLAAGRGLLALAIPADTRIRGEAWVQGGQLCLRPPAPNVGMCWDWPSKSWVGNLEDTRALKLAAVGVERNRRIFAPVIVYDGKNLDADAESIDRLSKKLAAIDAYEKRGQTMPVQKCVWRDADNVTHTFASHQEYKLWLAGFAVALDDRGAAAFAWSWAKKAQLALASTIAQIQAIVLND